MHRADRKLLWSAAVTLGLIGMPAASEAGVQKEGRAIDRLPEIRAALQGTQDEGKGSAKRSPLGKLLAQWGNWPNWSNWGNG